MKENQIHGEENLTAGAYLSPIKDSKKTGCFICGEGHWKRECPERRHSESANLTMEPKQLLVLTASAQDTNQEWIMDYGFWMLCLISRNSMVVQC